MGGDPRRLRVLVLGSVLLLAARAPCRAEEEGGARACEALLAAGKAREAVDCFRRLADAPGGDAPDVQSGLGRALLAAGDPRAAVVALRRVATTRGSAADHVTLAEALVGSAEARISARPSLSIEVVPFLQDALVAADAAGAEPAVAARVALVRGRAHFLLGDLPSARQALRSPALEGDRVAADLLGRVEYAAQDFPAAAAAFEAAGNVRAAATAWYAAKDPRVVDAYVALLRATSGDTALLEEAVGAARAASRPGDMERALGAIEPPPEVRAAWIHARARLLEWDGKTEEALARYREAAASGSGDPRPLVQVARLRFGASPDDPAAVEESVHALFQALALAPEDEQVRWWLGVVAARQAEGAARKWPDRRGLDRAIEIYAALAKADPADAVAWGNLGNARRIAGEEEASLDAYARAVESNPYDASLWNDRGLALLAAGKDDEGLAAFEKAASLDPSALSPRQNAARVRRLRGDLAASADRLQAALRAARSTGGSPMLYRFLLDQVERAWAGKDAR